jgi:hypothetical protein
MKTLEVTKVTFRQNVYPRDGTVKEKGYMEIKN